MSLTDLQQKAVDSQNGVIVTASAGAGKTKVLVERVVDKAINKCTDIDKMLIITFTNAAAAQMRNRIEQRLSELQKEDPENIAISRQKIRMSGAHISTIDSFCIDIVRENFDSLGIMPQFEIFDSVKETVMKDEVWNEITKPYLDENNEGFINLASGLGKYDDSRLKKAVLSVYDFAMCLPFGELWIENQRKKLENCNGYFGSDWDSAYCDCCKLCAKRAIKTLKYYMNDAAFDDNKDNDCYAGINEMYLLFSNVLTAAEQGKTKEMMKIIFESQNFEKTKKRDGISKIFNKSVDIFNGFYKNGDISSLSESEIEQAFCKTKEYTLLFYELAEKFAESFSEKMKSENIFSFSAISQMALKLLCEPNGEDYKLTKLANEIANTYDEVMVDEYQDTNDLQDTIVWILSDGGKKLFIVGDAKQSIYEFRGANPKNFIKKGKQDNGLSKVVLGDNFRSSKNVCEFVNTVFCGLMTEKDAEIEYKNQMLNSKRDEIQNNNDTVNLPVDIKFYHCDKKDAEIRHITEANHIAEYIYNLHKKDGKIPWGEYAILMRNAKYMQCYADALKKRGIPCECEKSAFCDKKEVKLALCFMSAVDNPTRNPELLAVMLSPIFGFTADELALLRKDDKKSSIWHSCINSESEKCINFCKEMRKYARLSTTMPLAQFADELFHLTDFYNIIGAMENGAARVQNIKALCRLADSFSDDSKNSVIDFCEYIKSGASERETGKKSENSVNISTLHKSKGLEYKVCIIADASAVLSIGDNNNPAIKNAELGVGFNVKENNYATNVISPVKAAIDKVNRLAERSAELRLLYVGLTRAVDKLAIFMNYNDKENINNLFEVTAVNENIPDYYSARSFSEWILQSLINNKPELCDKISELSDKESFVSGIVRYSYDINMPDLVQDTNTVPEKSEIDDKSEQLAKRLEYIYHNIRQTEIDTKYTVTEIAHGDEQKDYMFTGQPAFLAHDDMTPAQRGTATHLFMEYADYQKAEADPKAEIDRLYEYQYLTEYQAAAVDVDKLKKFFASPLYARMKNALCIQREIRFLSKYNDQDDCFSVLQGVADCVIEETDGMVIIDFKTDNVNDINVLVDRYKKQMDLYREVCNKIYGKKVKECIIYSFKLGEHVTV